MISIDFEEEKKLLSEHFIPDIQKLIMSYIDTPLEYFDDYYIDIWVDVGDYLYYTKEQTLFQHLIGSNGEEWAVEMLENSKYLKAEHFQNLNNHFITELSWLCNKKMSNIILKIKGLKPGHFTNKDIDGFTELYGLCFNKMSNVILLIDGWKFEHFLNKNNKKETSFHLLCKNNMPKVIMKIKGLKLEHFLYNSEHDKTKLYYLCKNKMKDIIKHFKFTEKHCTTDMERNYLKTILS